MSRLIIVCLGALALGARAPANAAEFKPNRMFVSSYTTNEIYEFKADGTLVGTYTGGGALVAPDGLAFGPDGNLYVACDGPDAIIAVDANDAVVSTWSAGLNLIGPTGIAFGPYGHLYVASRGTDKIARFHSDGTYLGSLDPGIVFDPWYLTFTPDGHLLVSNYGHGTLVEMTTVGSLVREIPAGTANQYPSGVTFGWEGRLYVNDSINESLIYLDNDGAELGSFIDTNLAVPMGLANGPNSRIFAACEGSSDRVIAVRAMGIPEEYGAGVGMDSPADIAFSPFRFKVALVGSLTGVAGVSKVSEKAVLSVAPGSQTVMLRFTDGPPTSDYVSVFGATAMVCHGLEGFNDFDDTTRKFSGTESTCPSYQSGSAAILLNVEGKIAGWQFFKVTGVNGRLWRTAEDSVSSVKIKFKAALN